MTTAELTTTFDYAQLKPEVFDALIDQENLLETVLIRSHQEIGEILIAVKALLPHGTFMQWYLSKGISKDMAARSIQFAEGQISQNANYDDLPAPRKNNRSTSLTPTVRQKPNDDKPSSAFRSGRELGLAPVYGKPDHRNIIYPDAFNQWGKPVKIAELNVEQRRQLRDLLIQDLQGYGDE